jgi:hypothetical protein
MMTLALALALQGSPMPPLMPTPTMSGRIYTSKSLHVGLRPVWFSTDGDLVYGMTLQITWLHLL